MRNGELRQLPKTKANVTFHGPALAATVLLFVALCLGTAAIATVEWYVLSGPAVTSGIQRVTFSVTGRVMTKYFVAGKEYNQELNHWVTGCTGDCPVNGTTQSCDQLSSDTTNSGVWYYLAACSLGATILGLMLLGLMLSIPAIILSGLATVRYVPYRFPLPFSAIAFTFFLCSIILYAPWLSSNASRDYNPFISADHSTGFSYGLAIGASIAAFFALILLIFFRPADEYVVKRKPRPVVMSPPPPSIDYERLREMELQAQMEARRAQEHELMLARERELRHQQELELRRQEELERQRQLELENAEYEKELRRRREMEEERRRLEEEERWRIEDERRRAKERADALAQDDLLARLERQLELQRRDALELAELAQKAHDQNSAVADLEERRANAISGLVSTRLSPSPSRRGSPGLTSPHIDPASMFSHSVRNYSPTHIHNTDHLDIENPLRLHSHHYSPGRGSATTPFKHDEDFRTSYYRDPDRLSTASPSRSGARSPRVNALSPQQWRLESQHLFPHHTESRAIT